MNSREFIRHDKRVTPRRFGTNRGSHWKVAGAVAAVILGGYVVYSSHNTDPTMSAVVPADAPVPTARAPLNQDNKGVD
jgi:hypothetical protein